MQHVFVHTCLLAFWVAKVVAKQCVYSRRMNIPHFYAALLPRRGPHIASHSVCLSVRPVIVAIGNVFSSTASVTDVLSARTEGIRTFRHALRAAYRTAISAAQILV